MKKFEDTTKLLEKAKKIVSEVVEKMEELGVNKLGPVYLTHPYNQTHGTQTRLHLVGDEYKSDLYYVHAPTSDHSVLYEFGDFDLPYVRPDLETVLNFLDSIDEINDAIEKINDRIILKSAKKYELAV